MSSAESGFKGQCDFMKKIYFSDDILIYFGNPVGYLDNGSYGNDENDENGSGEKKVIIDTIFVRDELQSYLTEKEGVAIVVRDGVYDELSEKLIHKQPDNLADDPMNTMQSHLPQKQPDSDCIADYYCNQSADCLLKSDNIDAQLLPRASPDKEAGKMPETKSQERQLRIYRLKPESSPIIRFFGLTERQKRGYGPPERKEYDLIFESAISDFDIEAVWDNFSQKGFGDLFLSISDVIELAGEGERRFFYVDQTCFTAIDFI